MTNPYGPQDPQDPQNGWSSIPDPQNGGTADPRNPYGTPGTSGTPDASGTWQGTTPPANPYGQTAQPEVPTTPPADPYGQGGYQQAGYQQAGYQQAGYQQQPGYQQAGYQQPQYAPQQQGYVAPKSMVVAILLALFLGGFGVHNFYLGYNRDGGLQLAGTILGVVLSGLFVGFILVFAVGVWVIINIFQIATRSGQYVTDAQGVPLQ